MTAGIHVHLLDLWYDDQPEGYRRGQLSNTPAALKPVIILLQAAGCTLAHRSRCQRIVQCQICPEGCEILSARVFVSESERTFGTGVELRRS